MAGAARRSVRFSGAAFVQGLMLGAAAYAVLAGWLWYEAPDTLALRQSHLAAVSVPITTESVATPPKAISQAIPTAPPAKTQTATAPTPAPATLPAAPLPGLSEPSAQGALPVVRQSDGMTPFKAYRRPFDRNAVKSPVVSLVVYNLGLSNAATQTALAALPPDVTFDVSPYAPALQGVINLARAKGHEVWLTVPVETSDYPRTDTGPNTLLIGAPQQQNLNKLFASLAGAGGYAGVMTGPDPAFLKSAGDLQPALDAIYGRGLGFADASDDPGTGPQLTAHTKNAPYASVDVWIDASASQSDIDAAFAALEQKAKAHGAAVGAIRPLPVSLHAAAAWAQSLAGKGLVLAPLSAQTGM